MFGYCFFKLKAYNLAKYLGSTPYSLSVFKNYVFWSIFVQIIKVLFFNGELIFRHIL